MQQHMCNAGQGFVYSGSRTTSLFVLSLPARVKRFHILNELAAAMLRQQIEL